MTPPGETARAGVMGWPVAHSLSPRLHGFWLDRYGIDGAYEPIAVPPEDFVGAIRNLTGTGFRGVNLTIPHKEAGLEICDEVDDLARRIGAVNTVVFEQGRLVGSNTDWLGAVGALVPERPVRELDQDGRAVPVDGGLGALQGIVLGPFDIELDQVHLLQPFVCHNGVKGPQFNLLYPF